MQIRKIIAFAHVILGLAHEKFDVWIAPKKP